jgi:HEAT repeat protein
VTAPTLDRVRRWWDAYLRAHPPRLGTVARWLSHGERVVGRLAGEPEELRIAALLHDAVLHCGASEALLTASRIPAPAVAIAAAMGRVERVLATPGAVVVRRACLHAALAVATESDSRNLLLEQLAGLDCADPATRPDADQLARELSGEADAVSYAAAALAEIGTADQLPALLAAYPAAERTAPGRLDSAVMAVLTGERGAGWRPRKTLPEHRALVRELAVDPQRSLGLRRIALSILGPEDGDVIITGIADPNPYVAAEAAAAAGRFRLAAAGTPLMALVGREDARPRDRASGARALLAVGVPREAVPLLAAVVEQASPRPYSSLWRHAVRALARHPGPEAERIALNLLHREGTYLRGDGAWLAGQLRQAEAVPVLLEVLRGGGLSTQSAAAQALGKLADPTAVPALIGAASASDDQLRREAIWALTRIGDPRALEAYLIAAADPWMDIALLAAKGLAGIDDPRTVPGLVALAAGPAARPALAGLLRRADPRSVPALQRALRGDDRVARRLAAAALVAVGAAEALRGMVLSGSSQTRRAAIWGLAELGDPADAGRLVSVLLNGEDPLVRARAAAALGRLGAAWAVVALVTALDDAHPRVRANAATALGALGGGQEALRAATSDPHRDVRDAATAALRRMG